MPAFILHGTNGSFIKQRADVQEDNLKLGQKPGSEDWGIEPVSAGGTLNINDNGKTIRTNIPSLRGNYMEFYEKLYESLTNKKSLPVTAEEGLNVMRIIGAVLESHNTKKIISIIDIVTND